MVPAATNGRAGKTPDGRARTREAKLAAVVTQTKIDTDGRPVRDPDSTSYLASFAPAAEFATQVHAEARRRGAEHIRQLVVLGDGAPWIWNLATPIVDLYHATETERLHLHPSDDTTKALGYFKTNAHRMRYAYFRERGLFVGSGVVEAGAKSFVGQRLKLSGMRWNIPGATGILTLRCHQASGRFEHIWTQPHNQIATHAIA